MKIDFVSEHASPLAVLGGADAGGQNVHVAELSAALVRQGHDVRVFTRRDDPSLPTIVRMPSGVEVVHLTAGPTSPIPKDRIVAFVPQLAERLREWWTVSRPEIVHAHFWMSGSAALDACAELGLPFVQTFHALGVERRREQGTADTSPSMRIDVERQIALAADRVVATSSSEIFELCRLGADPRKLKIVPCGVDVEAFRAPCAAPALPRSARYRAMTLSRLVPRKGVDDAIAALARLDDAELVIAGGPSAADLESDAEVARLREVARRHGVLGRVRFLGRVGRAAVPALLRSADVVICAAWYEPFGIVPLEAMAAGVPVVATAVGGQNDSVIDRYTGYHVPRKQPAAIAHAVADLLASPELRTRMGRAGIERVRSHYTWGRIARETLRVYHGVLDERRTSFERRVVAASSRSIAPAS